MTDLARIITGCVALAFSIHSSISYSDGADLRLICDGGKSGLIFDEVVDGERWFNKSDSTSFDFVIIDLHSDYCLVRYDGGSEYKLSLLESDELNFVCERIEEFGSGVFNNYFEYSERRKIHRLSISRVTGNAKLGKEDFKRGVRGYKNLLHHSEFSNCRPLERKF